MNTTDVGIRRGGSIAQDPRVAVAELHASIQQSNPALVVVFVSPAYSIDEIAAALRESFGEDAPIIGCTTAGEISPSGYTTGGLSGLSLPAESFSAVTKRIDDLENFEISEGSELASKVFAELQAKHPGARTDNSFGYLLVDGLSMREEAVISTLYRGLRNVPLFGGSAGDGLDFQETFLLHEGRVHRDAALVTLVTTDLPFEVFKTEHFGSTEDKIVVTEADPENRVVIEINGEKAGPEYARMLGLDTEKLTPMIFATHPVVVKIGGQFFVRSIQKVNPDGSLTFYCAIDEGVVLTIAKAEDIVSNLEQALNKVEETIGKPELILACDCILRTLELNQKQLKDRVFDLLAARNVVGFATYGEQFNAMHVNQTFTGVAIGSPR